MAFLAKNSKAICSLRKAFFHRHIQGIYPYDRSAIATVTPLKIHGEQMEIDSGQGSKGHVARDIERVLEPPREEWAHEQDMDQARTAE